MIINFQGINEKEEKAWKKLFEYYYAPLCCYANEYLHDMEQAEDIIQDILLKIWKSDYIFESSQHLNYYLYRSVYNNCISYHRKHHELVGISNEISTTWADEDFAATVKEEMTRRLYEEIQKLPTQRRKIIMLSIEGKSGKEIAEILNISINTVKAGKAKAIKALRKGTTDSPILLFL